MSSFLYEDTIEYFSVPRKCTVIESISMMQIGQVKTQGGVLYRAELHESTGQITLLSGQIAQAIGRRNNILIVVPITVRLRRGI